MYNCEDCSLYKDIQVKGTLAFLGKACVLEWHCFFPEESVNFQISTKALQGLAAYDERNLKEGS